MDEILASILTPEQQALAQQRAQQAALLNLGFGLLGASQGQVGQPRPGLGQIAAQVGPQVMQAYQGSFDQTLKNILTAQQLQEAQQKRAREASIQRALQLGTPQEQVNALRGLGAYDILGQMATAEKGIRQSGMLRQPGEMSMENPFAVYAQSTIPGVAKLAKEYQKSYESGAIDDEKASARLGDLAKMEESAFARRESAADRKLARDLAQGEREQKRVEGTEGQKLATGFAQRMVFSNATIEALEKTGEGLPGPGLPTEKTSLAGGVPVFGGYLQRQVMTPEQQRYKQAADNWIRANLRKESGAVIGADEMKAEYETYFPMPGDSQDTIDLKAQARKVTTDAMIKNAGPAFTMPELPSMPKLKDVRDKFGLEPKR